MALVTIIGTLFGTPTKTLIGDGILDTQDLLDSTTDGTGRITTITDSEIIGAGTMDLSRHDTIDSNGYLLQTIDTTEKETVEELRIQIRTRLIPTETAEGTTAFHLLEEKPHRNHQVPTTGKRPITKTQLIKEVVLRQATTRQRDKEEAMLQKRIARLLDRITTHRTTLLQEEVLLVV